MVFETSSSYSALKINGKPLYEYAREGKPLPKPIESRPVTISHLALTDFRFSASSGRENGHSFSFPLKKLSAEAQAERLKVLRLVNEDDKSASVAEAVVAPSLAPDNPDAEPTATPVAVTTAEVADEESVPPIFELEMTVSSGTYVRSVVHDLALAVDSAAHVVTLTRTRQAQFVLQPNEGASDEKLCVDWSIMEAALQAIESGEEVTTNEEGWADWELEVLEKLST